jgi:hypothetical protein
MKKLLCILALVPALAFAQGVVSGTPATQLPASLGQKTAANSISCVLASDALGSAAGTPSFVRLSNGTSAIGVDGTAGALYVENQPTSGTQVALSSSGKATLTTSVNVKASAGNLYGFSAVNGAATVCWLQCVDSAGAGTLGTAVIFQAALPASGTLSFPPGAIALANGASGIACGIASAVNGASACGTAGNVTLYYK